MPETYSVAGYGRMMGNAARMRVQRDFPLDAMIAGYEQAASAAVALMPSAECSPA